MAHGDCWQGMTWWRLLTTLHQIEWPDIMAESVEAITDHPRAMDGIRLRSDFVGRYYGDRWLSVPDLEGPVTMLEVMLGMSKWMEFSTQLVQSDDMVATMFWLLVHNVGLDHLPDTEWERDVSPYEVAEAMRRVQQRDYAPNGLGGFFHLRHTDGDVRQMTLWEQMQAWLLDYYV